MKLYYIEPLEEEEAKCSLNIANREIAGATMEIADVTPTGGMPPNPTAETVRAVTLDVAEAQPYH